MVQPWVLHHYPGVRPSQFDEGDWSISLYVAMWDYIQPGD